MRLEVCNHVLDLSVLVLSLGVVSDLTNSTKMFGRLADPNGENNALSQVLYGLALR